MKKPSKPEIVNMNVRIPREVRQAAKVAAAKRGQNLNAFVTEVLAKAAAVTAALVLLVGCGGPVEPDICGDAQREPSGACVVTPTHPLIDFDAGEDGE